MTRTLFAAAAAVALATLAGCGPTYDHLEFGQKTSPPLFVDLRPEGITLPEGIAVAVAPIPIAEGGDRMEDRVVTLISGDTGVLGCDRIPETGFVLYGARAGQARLSVFVDGEAVETIPAQVVKQ